MPVQQSLPSRRTGVALGFVGEREEMPIAMGRLYGRLAVPVIELTAPRARDMAKDTVINLPPRLVPVESEVGIGSQQAATLG